MLGNFTKSAPVWAAINTHIALTLFSDIFVQKCSLRSIKCTYSTLKTRAVEPLSHLVQLSAEGIFVNFIRPDICVSYEM